MAVIDVYNVDSPNIPMIRYDSDITPRKNEEIVLDKERYVIVNVSHIVKREKCMGIDGTYVFTGSYECKNIHIYVKKLDIRI